MGWHSTYIDGFLNGVRRIEKSDSDFSESTSYRFFDEYGNFIENKAIGYGANGCISLDHCDYYVESFCLNGHVIEHSIYVKGQNIFHIDYLDRVNYQGKVLDLQKISA